MKAVKILLFFVISSSVVSLMAQTNFLNGYYITSKQDTIHGFIEYRSERRNFDVCVFKKEMNSKSIKLYPKDIIGFTFENKDFYEMHLYKSKNREIAQGFFKVIFRGKISLLRNGSKYFVKDNNDKIYNITKSYEITGMKAKTNYYGLGILKFLMSECKEMSGNYLDGEYMSSPNYVLIFKKYYTCTEGPTIESEKIKIKPQLNVGIQASPTISNLITTYSAFAKARSKNEMSLGFGGYTAIFLPKVDEHIRFITELSFSKNDYYTYFTSVQTNDLFVNFSSIKVPVYLRYNIDRFFIDLGIQNQFILNQHSKWRVEARNQNVVSTYYNEFIPLNKRMSGNIVGIGVKHEIMNFPLRTSLRFSQLNDNANVNKPKIRSVELLISIQLK